MDLQTNSQGKLGDKLETIKIVSDSITLEGILGIPESARGIVLFAHGSGSSRFSPRNQYVAEVLRKNNIATLLFDLLTTEEEIVDMQTLHLRFDIPLLADRLLLATDWVIQETRTHNLAIGYFGASTGTAAALIAASKRPNLVQAIVSRGGRPDLAEPVLSSVKAPTLLIVGGNDLPVISINQKSLQVLQATKKLVIVPGATHLFEEPGALEKVAELAANWFSQYLLKE